MARIYVEAWDAQIHIDEIRDDIRHWLAGEIQTDAQRFAPVDTGYLSTHIEIHDDAHRVVATGAGVPPNEDAPAYVEFGTRPHLIHNAFGIPGYTVQHPGTPAQPYLRPAAYKRRRIPPSAVRSRGSWADR